MQVVERRGRAEGLCAALVKHPVGKTTPSRFNIKVWPAVRWLGGLERKTNSRCIPNGHNPRQLCHTTAYLTSRREIIN
jgi:hypothetical protein